MGVLLEVRGWLSEVGVEHGGVGNKSLLLPVPLPLTSRLSDLNVTV